MPNSIYQCDINAPAIPLWICPLCECFLTACPLECVLRESMAHPDSLSSALIYHFSSNKGRKEPASKSLIVAGDGFSRIEPLNHNENLLWCISVKLQSSTTRSSLGSTCSEMCQRYS